MGGAARFCGACGKPLRPGSGFCVSCGRPVRPPSDRPPRMPADSTADRSRRDSDSDLSATTSSVSSPREASGSLDDLEPDSRVRAASAGLDETTERAAALGPAKGASTSALMTGLKRSQGQGAGPAVSSGRRAPPPSSDRERPPPRTPDYAVRPRARVDRSRRGRQWPWLVALVVVLLVAGGTVVGVIAVLHKKSPPASSGHHSAQSAPPSHGVHLSKTARPPEQQAATKLAALLSQSVSDRSEIKNASQDVSSCGPNLSQDAQIFDNAANSRQSLLSQLMDLPGRSTLPSAMLSDLSQAWTASEVADQDLAGWAQDEVSNGCTQNDTSDSNYQAATQPDNEATAAKTAFVGLWNPLADRYGLPTYQWNQL